MKEGANMKISEIMNEIKSLAMSQGFYGRLYRALINIKNSDPEQWETVKTELESQEFANTLDMIFYFEC